MHVKKNILFTLSLILVLSASLSAQSILINNKSGQNVINDTITFNHVVDPTNTFEYFENKQFVDIINNSGGQMTVGLIRKEVTVVPNTYDYMCWGAQCFGEVLAGTRPVWDVNDSVIVANNDTASGLLGGLVIYHRPNGNAGTSIYEYELYDRANRNVSSSIFVKLQTTISVGLNEAAQQVNFEVFPNPVENELRLNFPNGIDQNNLEMILYDLTGKEMRRVNVQQGVEMQILNVADLNSGLYFISTLKDGERLQSKRFVKL